MRKKKKGESCSCGGCGHRTSSRSGGNPTGSSISSSSGGTPTRTSSSLPRVAGTLLLLPLSPRTTASRHWTLAYVSGIAEEEEDSMSELWSSELDTTAWSKCAFFGPRKCIWNVCGVHSCQTALTDHGKECSYKPKT